jgi:hypothetical protein
VSWRSYVGARTREGRCSFGGAGADDEDPQHLHNALRSRVVKEGRLAVHQTASQEHVCFLGERLTARRTASEVNALRKSPRWDAHVLRALTAVRAQFSKQTREAP